MWKTSTASWNNFPRWVKHYQYLLCSTFKKQARYTLSLIVSETFLWHSALVLYIELMMWLKIYKIWTQLTPVANVLKIVIARGYNGILSTDLFSFCFCWDEMSLKYMAEHKYLQNRLKVSEKYRHAGLKVFILWQYTPFYCFKII